MKKCIFINVPDFETPVLLKTIFLVDNVKEL